MAPEQEACHDICAHGGDGAESSSPPKEALGAEHQGREALKPVVHGPGVCPTASLEVGQLGPPSPVEEGRATLGHRLPMAVGSEAGLGSCSESPSRALPKLGGHCAKDPAPTSPLPLRQPKPVLGPGKGEQAQAALGVLGPSPLQPPEPLQYFDFPLKCKYNDFISQATIPTALNQTKPQPVSFLYTFPTVPKIESYFYVGSFIDEYFWSRMMRSLGLSFEEDMWASWYLLGYTKS